MPGLGRDLVGGAVPKDSAQEDEVALLGHDLGTRVRHHQERHNDAENGPTHKVAF